MVFVGYIQQKTRITEYYPLVEAVGNALVIR